MPRLAEIQTPISRNLLNALFMGFGFLLGNSNMGRSENKQDKGSFHVRTVRRYRREAKSLLITGDYTQNPSEGLYDPARANAFAILGVSYIRARVLQPALNGSRW